MAVGSIPHCFVNTLDQVFYKVPESRQIHLDQTSVYHYTPNIDSLIEELTDEGPLVAFGQFGPDAYTKDPRSYKTMHGHEIYGWEVGTERVQIKPQSIFVLGAQKAAEKGYVFFTMASYSKGKNEFKFRRYLPLPSDQRIYATSYDTFHRYVTSVHAPVTVKIPQVILISSAPSGPEVLSERDREYVQKLMSFPLESILADEKVKAECHAIGQKIFDEYKQAAGGKSQVGKEAAQRICNALHYEQPDGRKRKQYIEFAWAYIGDGSWLWYP